MIFERDPHRLFGVARGRELELVSRTERVRAGRVREVRWFVERGARGEAVARYRCWDERAAPGRRPAGGPGGGTPARELGWERYGPGGELLDREVRRARSEEEAVEVH